MLPDIGVFSKRSKAGKRATKASAISALSKCARMQADVRLVGDKEEEGMMVEPVQRQAAACSSSFRCVQERGLGERHPQCVHCAP